MTDAATVETAVADAHRRDWALVLAATVRVARDLDLAEDCVQEAYAAALRTWAHAGLPDNPAAWLTTTARRRAIDEVRRDASLRSRLPLLVEPPGALDEAAGREQQQQREHTEADADTLRDALPDERLRLIFICCHPALAQEAQVALTLRLVCGVPVPDIARAFLVSEATMAARITRAKKKISVARIPYRIPSPGELPDRLRGALAVIHLLFTAGHTAPSGASLVRADLVDRAMHLARMLRQLMPASTDVHGLYALLLVTDARRATRVDADGRLVRLADQDRSRWDRGALAEAHDVIVGCLRAGPPGRYALQAAIASLYAEAPTYDETDWPQIIALYDRLTVVWPSPIVALNRAVPLAMVAGPEVALAEVERLERDGRLSGYQYLPAVKADLLSRLGRADEAADAYRQALALAANEAERAFLTGQLPGLLAVAWAGVGDDDRQRRDEQRDDGHDHRREDREAPDQGPGQHNQDQADAHQGEVGPPPGGQAERARPALAVARRRRGAAGRSAVMRFLRHHVRPPCPARPWFGTSFPAGRGVSAPTASAGQPAASSGG
jgi:RNA polymerase sigma factor (sigma-70 family)